MSAHRLPTDLHQADWGYYGGDPGTGKTITVFQDFTIVPLVSVGTETRTLARPTRQGIFCTFFVKTSGGNITLTVTGNYDTNGDSTIVFTAVKQHATFVSAYDGTNYYWILISGTALANALGSYAPSTWATQFGSGTGTFLEEGNLYRQAYGISDVGGQPAATGADKVIAAYTLPANSLDGTGFRGLNFQMQGNFAATGNNKTCKIIVGCTTAAVGTTVTGGTTLCTTGVSAGNNLPWYLSGTLFKYGAANFNTQSGMMTGLIIGTTHSGATLAVNLTLTENAAILIAFTGNAATAATDIQMTLAEVNAMN